jgi:hypothetical protein
MQPIASYEPASFSPCGDLFFPSVASRVRAGKVRLIPPDETALLRAANYDQFR